MAPVIHPRAAARVSQPPGTTRSERGIRPSVTVISLNRSASFPPATRLPNCRFSQDAPRAPSVARPDCARSRALPNRRARLVLSLTASYLSPDLLPRLAGHPLREIPPFTVNAPQRKDSLRHEPGFSDRLDLLNICQVLAAEQHTHKSTGLVRHSANSVCFTTNQQRQPLASPINHVSFKRPEWRRRLS